MYDFDEEEYRQLLGFPLPENNLQSFKAQDVPKIESGLLGSANADKTSNVINNGVDAAAQIGQYAQRANQMASDNLISQRQAVTQQNAQQALAQRQNGQHAAGNLFGNLLSLLIPGGSLLGYLKDKL